ncbi:MULTISPECIES: hypothetical protein [unclassified Saccharibacter]|uniref:hypothetical protein n=1 Tax=unclassified Saccharibacter TaxID=2648722 RepID=UPI00132A4A85|nr:MULTISPECIES: hypothetical protein [unclassified Saccharibacter]MXV35666.1 hypothetical protein [Saccharibacter sp. EH611]MXV58280.1 hypothetical protein [Saccharibacter sp. EH70]MXV66423.1 hypothetical protein [Saccharibacter sp. EH60]
MPANDNSYSDDIADFLNKILKCEKHITSQPEWKIDHGFWRFSSLLYHNNVALEGIYLFGRARSKYTEGDITLGLNGRVRPFPRAKTFERFDWRPNTSHNNQNIGPVDYRLEDISGTHRHTLELNKKHPNGLEYALQYNLPIALPFCEGADDWDKACLQILKIWNISGLGKLRHPDDIKHLPLFGGEE